LRAGITAIEFYAGGGGFSRAFLEALTLLGWSGRLLLAVNHDPEAIQTHRQNFPDTEHRQANVEQLVMEDLADALVLFGSPECRCHANAQGQKHHQRRKRQLVLWTDAHTVSEAEKSRASMWQMYEAARAKMTQEGKFQVVLVENIVEAATRWADHDDWVEAFTSLGYRYQGLFLNARCFGVPQNRDRYFAVFTLATLPVPDLDLRPQAPCLACGQAVAAAQCWKPAVTRRQGKYRTHYDYRCPACHEVVEPFFRPAVSFLDLADRGQRIGERTRPLCANTRRRIEEGLAHFCRQGQVRPPQAYDVPDDLPPVLPFLVKYNSNGKAESIFQPLGTVSSRDRYGLVFLPEDWTPGTIPALEACSFRMLSPGEVQRAMCLHDLVISRRKNTIIKQCGLAVPPPLAIAILLRLLPILAHAAVDHSPSQERQECSA